MMVGRKKRSQRTESSTLISDWRGSVRAIRAEAGNQIRSEMIINAHPFSVKYFLSVFIPLAHNFLSTVFLSLMTEYDFSPEAVDAYVKKQQKIGRWVNDTKRHPPANPFTPATPAVHVSEVNREESHASERRHRRRASHDKHRDMDMVRDMSPEGVDNPKHRVKHNRSASYSTNTRPEPPRSRTLPQPLQLGPYQNNFISSTHLPSPTSAYPHYPYPQKLTSPRDSKHSSRTSSSTWIQPAVNPYYPQTIPHSAPVYPRQPVRSQTIPQSYGHPMQHHVAHPNRSMGYLPVERILPPCANCADLNLCSLMQNAPQLPHSYYQSKRPPLLKRLFMGLTGSSKHKPPRRKRSMSF